jgi:flagellar hook-associated protein 2
MSLSPLTFTGVSAYSSDFQTIVDRATSIASLPIKQLQNQQADIVQQRLLVSNINTTVAALATSVSNLGTLAQQKGLAATSSNTAKVTAVNANSPSPAVYTLTDITSVAKSAAETSLSGYTNATTAPASSTGVVKLVVGTRQYTIDISSANNLTNLRNVINNLNAGVTASVLTTGTGATPYYLSITANSTGAKALQLFDDPDGANTNLLTALNQGANTDFKLNGVTVSKSTTLINDVVPGVTFNVIGTTTGTEAVTVTLASDRSKLSSALSEFVNAYNSARDQVNAQIGKNAGLLSGDFLVREVQSRLRAVASYTGTGSIKGLADLGVEFGSDGVATFNKPTVDALSDSRLSEAFTFLGSSTTGFAAQAGQLTSISDAVTGLARIQLDKYDETDKRLSAQIAQMTLRVSDMQKSLAARLHAADSLLASLESQQTMVDASLQSLNYTLYGKEE